MDDASIPEPALPTPNADELHDALRLIDPAGGTWHAEMVRRWVSSDDPPYLLPAEVMLALTVVSPRIRDATDRWLSSTDPEERSEFENERSIWERVAKGEIPSPGWQGEQTA
jgi:hypothetical protein